MSGGPVLKPLRRPWLWLGLWIVAIITVIVLSLVPPPEMNLPSGADKVEHFIAYAAIAGSAVQLFDSRRLLLWIGVAMVALTFVVATVMYLLKPELPAKVGRALALLEAAAALGSVEANRELGRKYRHGEGVMQHPLRAMQYYGAAAEQGDAPAMSAIEVTSGSLAVAGSRPKRDSTNGNDMPIRLPTSTTTIMVIATTAAMSTPPRQTPISEIATAIVRPSSAAMTTSRASMRLQSRVCTSPVASARTINVADWEPALPELAISSGRKKSNARCEAIISS